MKALITKLALATSVALATLFTAQAASAQPRHQPQAYDAQANPNYGFGPPVGVQPNDVISGSRQIGRDPDPFVRDQLLREYDSRRPD
jgi:hypothetical protein